MNNKIAILILAHKGPEQLSKLVKEFDDERFDVFVHIDAKSSMDFQTPQMVKSKCCIVSKEERTKIYLNDFSLVEATLVLAELAVKTYNYKYYILLTGQDYPIKSNDYIFNKLMCEYPTCWIDSYGLEDARAHGVGWVEHVGHKRFSQRMRRCLQKLVGRKLYYSRLGKFFKAFAVAYDRTMSLVCLTPREKVKRLGFEYSAGSHFWMLPDVAISHILDVYRNNKDLCNVFRHVAAPEETFFQTALSKLQDTVVPEPYGQFKSVEATMDNPALRLIKWYENGVHTSGHPAIWSSSDYEIIAHANALFARKFEKEKSIIELIDGNLR